MKGLLDFAINQVIKSKAAFCHFITMNDTGATGGHQYGFYIPKSAVSLVFDKPGVRGENMERHVKITWQNAFETQSRFVYYGKGSRNEYRITQFGKDFPFLREDYCGSLMVITKDSEEEYSGIVLDDGEDIENFYLHFNLSPTETNQLIDYAHIPSVDPVMSPDIERFTSEHSDFPDSVEMARFAEECYNKAHALNKVLIRRNPDAIITDWITTEYRIFRSLEEKIYQDNLSKKFSSSDELLEFSKTILNRRKARAGKSLEHHLASIFRASDLQFEEQIVTEDNKKPDFIFPSGTAYHDALFPVGKLVFLGAKTTMKDRWRQILNEANRIKTKHLFTLQEGLSNNQLLEVQHENVQLVMPSSKLRFLDKSVRHQVWTLGTFVDFVKEKQSIF